MTGKKYVVKWERRIKREGGFDSIPALVVESFDAGIAEGIRQERKRIDREFKYACDEHDNGEDVMTVTCNEWERIINPPAGEKEEHHG